MAKLNKNFRQQIGIPQGQMADFLGVNRLTLSAYENGRRQLPAAAATRLYKLELLYLQQQKKKPAAKPADNKLEKAKTAAQVQAYLKRLQIKALQLEQKLEKVKEMHTAYTKLHQLMTAVLNDKTSSSEDKIWADMFVRLATKKANLNGSAIQTVLQLKQDALLYQVTKAAGFLKDKK